MDPNAVTAAGNAVFALPPLAVVLMAITGHHLTASSTWARLVLRGLLLALLAISVRIGQWLLAIWTRDPPDKYGAWILEVRDEVTFLSALVFSAGCTMCMAGFARSGTVWQWIGVGVLVTLVSAVIGYALTPKG